MHLSGKNDGALVVAIGNLRSVVGFLIVISTAGSFFILAIVIDKEFGKTKANF